MVRCESVARSLPQSLGFLHESHFCPDPVEELGQSPSQGGVRVWQPWKVSCAGGGKRNEETGEGDWGEDHSTEKGGQRERQLGLDSRGRRPGREKRSERSTG